jgi:hypothetical protein
MTIRNSALVWLFIAVAGMVGESLVHLAMAPTLLGAVAAALAVLISWLLIRGSRIAWVIACLATCGQLVTLMMQGDFNLLMIVSTVILICLVTPPVIRDAWTDRDTRRSSATGTPAAFNTVKQVVPDSLTRVAFWSMNALGGNAGEAALRLGVAVVLLPVPLTFIDNEAHGAVMRVFVGILWTCWALVIAAFVGALLLAGARYMSPHGSSRSARKRK